MSDSNELPLDSSNCARRPSRVGGFAVGLEVMPVFPKFVYY
jgi:hypothetical protein